MSHSTLLTDAASRAELVVYVALFLPAWIKHQTSRTWIWTCQWVFLVQEAPKYWSYSLQTSAASDHSTSQTMVS